jgi:site-specific DNA-methyltransferase (adenine-specific)
VLKPGAHLVAMGGTRTYARMAVAIEDAGFEVRDTIAWLYGSGFPKSHDVSKGIDRMLGGEREPSDYIPNNRNAVYGVGMGGGVTAKRSAPGGLFSDAWEGWGTALKPAMELICLARKPLSEGTIAANVLKWGTGAINVDGCRVAHDEPIKPMRAQKKQVNSIIRQSGRYADTTELKANGRWPANLIHDGSAEVIAAFPDSGPAREAPRGSVQRYDPADDDTKRPKGGNGIRGIDDDGGSAARFFYTAKADADDRLGSKHPTVKPLDLMQWLVRLVTPPRALVLDPFAGTGTTAEAAWREGMSAVLIEREEEYRADIRRRMALALAGPDERAFASIKAKNLPRDDGPLFGGRLE